MEILSSDKAVALATLATMALDREHYRAIVFGATGHAKDVATSADEKMDGYGQVVVLPDPTILDGLPQYAGLAAARKAGAEVVFVNNAFELISQLSGLDATDPIKLEEAAEAAEGAAK